MLYNKRYAGDAAWDLGASHAGIVPAKGRALVSTKVYLTIPEGHVGLLWSRSGLSAHKGIEVGAGCIDSGYGGEIVIVLYNHSFQDFHYKEGDRLAQLLVIPLAKASLTKEVTIERGDNGFGSSGL